jgi:hypothetical protein
MMYGARKSWNTLSGSKVPLQGFPVLTSVFLWRDMQPELEALLTSLENAYQHENSRRLPIAEPAIDGKHGSIGRVIVRVKEVYVVAAGN